MRLQALPSSSRSALSGLVLFAALGITTTAGSADVTPSKQAEAAKLNNFGTALMNQQLLDKAQAKFAEAYQLDPSLVHAEVNRGIALIYLQKMPEAKQALEQAAAQDPKGSSRLVRAGHFVPHRSGVSASPWKAFKRQPPLIRTTRTLTTSWVLSCSNCINQSRL